MVLELCLYRIGAMMPLWYTAAVYEQIDVLDWLYDHDCPESHRVRLTTKQYSREAVIAWADRKGI